MLVSGSPVIYAFVARDEIVKIGKSNALGKRLRQWQNDVSAALKGEVGRGKTPLSEAVQWREYLVGDAGDLYAREGTVVTTPVGVFNAYEWEERELIRRHKPRMCHDWGKRGRAQRAASDDASCLVRRS